MPPNTLSEPRRIAIIGGGPAGALCAYHLRRMSLAAGRCLDVDIFDRKQFGVTGPRGCNMCAGIISNGLVEKLAVAGISIPPGALQRSIDAYVLEVRGAHLRLERPPGARIYSAFRSGGPMGEEFGTARSFDHVLLGAALGAGAQHVPRVIGTVHLPRDTADPVILEDTEGNHYEADAVVGAFGVNSRMADRFETLGFGYRKPQAFRAAQCEVPLEPDVIDRHFGSDVKVFALGVRNVKLAAMIPKERHVTVSLVGPAVGQADLEEFLARPEVLAHLPAGWQLPERYCHCHPLLPVTSASNVVADRAVVIGDAHVSRYLKNGLDSAFTTASLAAEAILSGGVSRENLERRYVRPCRRAFTWDNWCGRVLFGAHHALGMLPRIAAAHLRLARREQATEGPRPLNRVLWGMLTGDETYAQILLQALEPRLQASLALEAVKALIGREPVSPATAWHDEAETDGSADPGE